MSFSEIKNILNREIQYIKGIGGKKAELYRKLEILTLSDLIYYSPRRYIDLRGDLSISSLVMGEHSAIKVGIVNKSRGVLIRKGLTVFKVKVTDGLNDITLTFYNNEYLIKSLNEDSEYVFYGVAGYENGSLTLISPILLPNTDIGKFSPIYSATAGLSSKVIAKDIKTAIAIINNIPEEIPSIIPTKDEGKFKLISLKQAINTIHSPNCEELKEKASMRLSIEELIPFVAALMFKKSAQTFDTENLNSPDMLPFWNSLPFSPTTGQTNAVNDILNDMCSSNKIMSRMVQGDVGSGKTVVGAAAAYIIFKNKMQCSFMAPTEVLATQHYEGLKQICENLGIKIALLTGSTKAKEKKLIKEILLTGEIDFLIGTHALLTDDVLFKNLKLVITDEQHRFGVAQRAKLLGRGESVHTLVMSATPIPRSLSLIIFGDLDVSSMQTVPKGRLPIKTYLATSKKREGAYNYIKDFLDKGNQAYIVCSRIDENEEDDDTNLISAVKLYNQLNKTTFSGYNLGLLHGKMKPKEKEKVMSAFRNGDIDLLIATSVIEVGVDVPNAVVILIENAERFGLSQLHQLRGRVGRGSIQSHCILISDSRSATTRERLKTLVDNTDGFRIAEMDLNLRGPGDFFGKRQHGLPAFMAAENLKDSNVLNNIQNYVSDIVKNDPNLSNYPILREKSNALLEKLQNTVN